MKKMMIMAAACLMAAMTFAAQCAATTLAGTQCKRQAAEGSKYCWQHGKSTAQCQATTDDGVRCKRKAEPGSKFCWQHANAKAKGEGKAEAKGAGKGAGKSTWKKAEAKPVEAAQPDAAGQCKGVTSSGKPCNRKAQPGSDFCWQHANAKAKDEAKDARKGARKSAGKKAEAKKPEAK